MSFRMIYTLESLKSHDKAFGFDIYTYSHYLFRLVMVREVGQNFVIFYFYEHWFH